MSVIPATAPGAQSTTPAAAGVVWMGRERGMRRRLLAAPRLDRFLELVVPVQVAGTFAAVNLVEDLELCVEPARQLLVAGIGRLVGLVDQHEMDARIVGLLFSA